MGNKEAFRRFYDDQIGSVCNYFRRLGCNQELTEDLVQDTFVEAYRSFHTIKEPKAQKSWVMTIARRQIAKKIRSGILEDAFADLDMLPFGEDSNCERNLDAQRACRAILHRIVLMKPRAKQLAIAMFFLEERPLREISDLVETNISTLTTWCNRFRQDCRDLLESQDGVSPEGSVHILTRETVMQKGSI